MKKLLAILSMLVLILACGSKSGNESGTKDESKKPFSLNVGTEPASIDPQISTDIAGGTVNDFISEGLLKLDKDGKIVAGLAEKYEASEDGLKWTFTLRDGIKWSNGEPITANDFKVAWVRALNPEVASEYAYMLYPIKNGEKYNTGKGKVEELGINVIDDKTIEITLEAPTPYFDDLIMFKTYMPLNEKFYNEHGEAYATEADKILSSGPYIIKSWVHDSEMILEKNPNYYGANDIKLDKIVLKLIADNTAAFNAYKNGEVDVTSITVDQAKEYEGKPELLSKNDGSVWYLLLNNKQKELANIKIRKAILMAVDREEMTKSVLNGSGVPAKTLVPAGIGMKGQNAQDFTEEVSTQIPEFNVEEAKKLLAEGLNEVGSTQMPVLEMVFNDSGNNKVIAEFVQESLNKNLGITLNLQAMTFQERIARMKQKDFDFVLAGWSGDFHDPITYLDLFVTNGGNNHGSYSNARYDELVRTIKATADPAVRYLAMVELEKIISEDIPVGVLYHREKKYLVNPRVKGLGFKAIGGEYDALNVTLE